MQSTVIDPDTDCLSMRGAMTYLATNCPLMQVERVKLQPHWLAENMFEKKMKTSFFVQWHLETFRVLVYYNIPPRSAPPRGAL